MIYIPNPRRTSVTEHKHGLGTEVIISPEDGKKPAIFPYFCALL